MVVRTILNIFSPYSIVAEGKNTLCLKDLVHRNTFMLSATVELISHLGKDRPNIEDLSPIF